MNEELTVGPTTAIQIETLMKLTGLTATEILATAIYNMHTLAIFQAARSPSFSEADLLDALVPLGGRLGALAPAGHMPSKATESVPVPHEDQPAPSPLNAPAKSNTDALCANDTVLDADRAMVLQHAGHMTVPFVTRGLAQVIESAEGRRMEHRSIVRVLNDASWPREMVNGISTKWLPVKALPKGTTP